MKKKLLLGTLIIVGTFCWGFFAGSLHATKMINNETTLMGNQNHWETDLGYKERGSIPVDALNKCPYLNQSKLKNPNIYLYPKDIEKRNFTPENKMELNSKGVVLI